MGSEAAATPAAPNERATAATTTASAAHVQGTLDNRPFDAAYAAIVWDWPGDWNLVLADRAPEEGSANQFADGTTLLRVKVSRGPTVAATPGDGQDESLIFSHVGANEDYEGDARATIVIADVSGHADDASADYPQAVGSARFRIRGLIPPASGHAGGTIEGEGVVPVVFQSAPHVACRASAPPPSDVTWSENPSLSNARGALRGNARGHAFTPRTVFFEKERNQWRLVLTTGEGTERPSIEQETMNVDLQNAPRRGRITRAMASGGGFFQTCAGLGTTSWNADNAYAIEITKWQVGRCVAGENGRRSQLGTASGKIVVMYRGWEEGENTWVAGEFADVPVVADSCE